MKVDHCVILLKKPKKMDKRYGLLHWEDLYINVIDLETVKYPRKDVSNYREGEYIKANFKGKIYDAVISEISHDRGFLERKKKEKLKFTFESSVLHSKRDTNNDEGKQSISVKRSAEDNKTTQQLRKEIESNSNDANPPAKKKKTTSINDKENLDSSELPKKKKASDISDEAKKVAAADKKKNRELAEERHHTSLEKSSKVLETQNLEKMMTRDQEVKNVLFRVENKIETLTSMVDAFLACKTCVKKAYKKLNQPALPGTLFGTACSMSSPSGSTCSMSSPSGSACSMSSPSQKLPVVASVASLKPKCLMPCSDIDSDLDIQQSFSSIQKPFSSVTADNDDNKSKEVVETVKSIEEVQTVDSDTSLVYVGESRYGVRVKAVDYQRCLLTAKSAEKLALNLIEFILSKEEINSISVYGNVQHKLLPMEESKREALRSCIFSNFTCSESDKTQIWGSTVRAVNDKIRKKRTKNH